MAISQKRPPGSLTKETTRQTNKRQSHKRDHLTIQRQSHKRDHQVVSQKRPPNNDTVPHKRDGDLTKETTRQSHKRDHPTNMKDEVVTTSINQNPQGSGYTITAWSNSVVISLTLNGQIPDCPQQRSNSNQSKLASSPTVKYQIGFDNRPVKFQSLSYYPGQIPEYKGTDMIQLARTTINHTNQPKDSK